MPDIASAPADDPTWYKDAVIYQLHLKSFFDSDNDGVGDFRGLIEKLDYIAELGVTAIWLLPFYPSPRRDDGYDIADYRGVHPDYGTLADARDFIQAAHERGLRVIAELVINHTSDQHPWFQRARAAPPGSPERNFYVWSDTDAAYAGTRIIFLDTEKSNWTWDPVANAYFWHRFYSHQPDLNFDNPAVMEEVLSIMRFWLDLGVDGLRLDAVPYLIEREGTNNENLPETHAILKRIRAELDLHAPGRMLLAEANQWPEDAQAYFGESDECHMSFHFPLMPRMYMAIAREDRFPITDIMRQTPAIPLNCQWAIFLRNHDELTLEMVTTSERDYLWETYAADRRARLNLGIRRRLAPLLQRDRRRIELMNGLLLSMPGTPVIYYGDEIGMGDNIFLGDRDGVRTPMQWSIDRNGGFSRADPAKLVLPPIMDPTYGYQAVNVEAEAGDLHSLLNWMRRMLAVRQRHHAFGRGTQEFLYPTNRKVLAYLRTLEGEDGETILCVSNLSRSAQAVELDLSAYAGRVPVDIVGGSAFPAIGQLTYLLTLPPYAFYWFLLATEVQFPAWHMPQPEALPEFATIVLRRSIEEVRPGYARQVLEREALPAYLAKRRWFASRGEAVTSIHIAYARPLNVSEDPVMMTEVEVRFGERMECYALPMGIAWDDEITGPLSAQLALARVRRGPRVGFITDAFAIDAFARSMLRNLRDSAVLPLDALTPGATGSIAFRPTELMAELDLSEDAPIRRLSSEQSSSALVIGDAVVLKVVRRVLPGINPECETTRFLARHGFTNTPPLYGEIVRLDGNGTPHTIGLLQGFIRNQGDGWVWTLDVLDRTVSEMSTTDGDQNDDLSAYNAFAAAIGRRLGELHALLALPADDPAFAPEPADAATLEHWAEAAAAQIDAALAVLRETKEWPNPQLAHCAAILVAHAEALRAVTHRLAEAGAGALRTRVHGDFHLGRVLVVQSDAYLIDFEGDMSQTAEQRRTKTSPLRDVAGLLRSFDYAAVAALPGRVAASAQASGRRAEILDRFRAGAEAAFLSAYHAVLAEAPNPWAPPRAEQQLLDLFLLEKAAREICYEAANRPSWIGIPIQGLYGLAARLIGLPPENEDA